MLLCPFEVPMKAKYSPFGESLKSVFWRDRKKVSASMRFAGFSAGISFIPNKQNTAIMVNIWMFGIWIILTRRYFCLQAIRSKSGCASLPPRCECSFNTDIDVTASMVFYHPRLGSLAASRLIYSSRAGAGPGSTIYSKYRSSRCLRNRRAFGKNRVSESVLAGRRGLGTMSVKAVFDDLFKLSSPLNSHGSAKRC